MVPEVGPAPVDSPVLRMPSLCVAVCVVCREHTAEGWAVGGCWVLQREGRKGWGPAVKAVRGSCFREPLGVGLATYGRRRRILHTKRDALSDELKQALGDNGAAHSTMGLSPMGRSRSYLCWGTERLRTASLAGLWVMCAVPYGGGGLLFLSGWQSESIYSAPAGPRTHTSARQPHPSRASAPSLLFPCLSLGGETAGTLGRVSHGVSGAG